MARTHTAGRDALFADVERSGYYPAVVAEALDGALGAEPVDSYVIHQETTFDQDEVRRHVTVLALTPARLIVAHTDEHGHESADAIPMATTSTESVRLDRVGSVVVSRTIANPQEHVPGAAPAEVTLTIGWGAVGRVDLEPASCSDPTCEADHGYTGSVTADDLSLRVSAAAEGPDVVARTLDFAAALSRATSRT